MLIVLVVLQEAFGPCTAAGNQHTAATTAATAAAAMAIHRVSSSMTRGVHHQRLNKRCWCTYMLEGEAQGIGGGRRRHCHCFTIGHKPIDVVCVGLFL